MIVQNLFVRDVSSLEAWLSDRQIEGLWVVSPHLDDAAFSLAGMLDAVTVPVHVHSVFTTADTASDPAWAQATGFRDAAEEYAQRTGEDRAAMERLGVPFSHGGLAFGRVTDEAAIVMVEGVLAQVPAARVLVLLPLGAGRTLGRGEKLLRRALRRPYGSPVHSDHVWVRDRLGAALAGRDGIVTGYYAELPYLWANSARDLAARAAGLIGGPMVRVTHRPDADAKLAVAACYRSQLAPILGDKPAYQRKVCAAPEAVFLPEATA